MQRLCKRLAFHLQKLIEMRELQLPALCNSLPNEAKNFVTMHK